MLAVCVIFREDGLRRSDHPIRRQSQIYAASWVEEHSVLLVAVVERGRSLEQDKFSKNVREMGSSSHDSITASYCSLVVYDMVMLSS